MSTGPRKLLTSADLLKSSKRWMQRGLEAFGGEDDDADFAVHHAGVAVEHLLKAYLAAQHPVLVVEGSHFDSLLHGVGLGTEAKVPLSRVRTIGATEAFKRSKSLLRTKLVVDDRQMAIIAESRNGVAHIGLHERSEVEEALANCFRIADVVLLELNEDAALYWAGYQQLHDQLVKEVRDRWRARYEAKIATAKQLFDTRFGQMEEPAFELVREALDLQDPFPDSDTERAECPACGQQGWLGGEKRVEYDYEYDHRGDIQGGAWVVMTADAFACVYCKLYLDEGELAFTSIETEIETDDHVGDYLDEPDEDHWRDR